MLQLHFTPRLAAFLAPLLVNTVLSLPPPGLHDAPDAAVELDASGVQLVRLRRRQARDFGVHSNSYFYTARVLVGYPRPQPMNVALDTASGQVILASSSCSSSACLEHARYRPRSSESAVDINADGTLVQQGQRLATRNSLRDAISIGFSSLDLGDGTVTGHFLADAVCLHTDKHQDNNTGYQSVWPSAACAEVGLVAATHLSDTPFRAAPYDGSIGLGLQGLAVRKAFSFLETLGATAADTVVASNLDHVPLQQFALYHGPSFGEAAFGGHNPKRLSSPLQWTPVTKPEEGYWQFTILGLRIGNQTLPVCQNGGCRGLIDSATSKVGVPSDVMSHFSSALSATPLFRRDGGGCAGPDLHLEVSGGVELTLKAEDYADREHSECSANILPLSLPESFAGVFILGESLLRRYYTVFDWKHGVEQIGFGLAADQDAEELRIVSDAEAAEDVAEALEARASSEPVDEQVLPILLQAFFIRIVVVISMIFVGTHIVSSRSPLRCLERLLSYRGLLLEVAEFSTAVPSNEAPDGDECVICLGSCEDDPETISGVLGLQMLCRDAGCCSASASKGSQTPRWRRLKCGHHFHETCIFEWLRKAKQCPVCRCPLNGKASDDCTGAERRLLETRRSSLFGLLEMVHGTVEALSQAQQ